MDAKQINQTFDLVSYVSRLVKLKKNGAYYIGPCPGCGGRDRFNIKRAEADLWICRRCGDGKYHDAISFVMHHHKLAFNEAVKRMTSEFEPRRALGTGQPVRTPAPIQLTPEQDWQAVAWKEVDKACTSLTGGKAGEVARCYLSARGISRGAIFMNLLGYAVVYRRPAIVIPYLDVGDIITAVKYRFIDEQAQRDKGKRFAMKAGSLPYLFGLQHVLPSDRALLFVEGELNSISILQTLPRGVSVISAGSHSNGNAELLHALAAHYDRVVIWMDEPTKAAEMRKRMERSDAKLLKSPFINHTKWDANEMLKAGLLGDFLTDQLSTVCDGISAPTLFAAKAEA